MRIILEVLLCVVLAQVLVEFSYAAPTGQQQQQQLQENPWILRKADFYRNTTFELSRENVQLMGGKFSLIRAAHLPFWFDFELFKNVFKKSYPDASEELARHRMYVRTCVRTLKERIMYRILASNENPTITSQADQSFIEQIPTEAPGKINESGGASREGAAVAAASAKDQTEASIEFSAELGLDLGSDLDAAEEPLKWAVRLVRSELDQVESRNQLETYLKAFEEPDGLAIDGQLSY